MSETRFEAYKGRAVRVVEKGDEFTLYIDEDTYSGNVEQSIQDRPYQLNLVYGYYGSPLDIAQTLIDYDPQYAPDYEEAESHNVEGEEIDNLADDLVADPDERIGPRGPLAIRYNILRNKGVRDKFVAGVMDLRNQGKYAKYVKWHAQAVITPDPPPSGWRDAAHTGPAFTPWHRHFLWLFEKDLQEVLNDPEFGLPYWAWEEDAPELKNSKVWTNDLLGNHSGKVSKGPFAGWKIFDENGQATNMTLKRSTIW